MERADKIELLDLLEEQERRRSRYTVIGLVCPDKGLTHSIKHVKGQWVTTLEPAQVYLPAKLERVIRSDKRFIVVIGGRGSGKSIGVGDICAIKAKDDDIKTYCLREYQSSIKNSVHSLLKEEIKRLEFDGFEVLDNTIRFNGEDVFQFAGLARNVDSIKSAHGFSNYWLEEGQTISADSLETLTPTARNKPNKGLPGAVTDEVDMAGVSMTFVANPKSSEDPFSKRFITPFLDAIEKNGYYEDDLHLVVKMNYTDNPWYGESGLERERVFDYNNKPRALYDHIWLGAFNDDVDNSIIKPEWFDAAIDAHEKSPIEWKPKGLRVASHDPADGGDNKGYAMRHGTIVLDVDEHTVGDGNVGCDWATGKAIRDNADMFVYDADGMGALLRRQINTVFEGKGTRIEAFKGSEGVDDPKAVYQGKNDLVDESRPRTNADTFRNKRSQKYISLADRFYLTYQHIVNGVYADPDDMISISSNVPNIGKLRSELCRIPLTENGAGYIQVMTKLEMKKKHKINSPGMADSVYMLWGVPMKRKAEVKPLNLRRSV